MNSLVNYKVLCYIFNKKELKRSHVDEVVMHIIKQIYRYLHFIFILF